MPVFTAWYDLVVYNKATRMTTALVNDTNWDRPAGVNNQERWITHAEQENEGIIARTWKKKVVPDIVSIEITC